MMLVCACSGATPLHVDDGHELWPKYLGVGHLREAFINCGILPPSLRQNRLRQVEYLLFRDVLPVSGVAQQSSVSHKQGKKHRCGSQESISGPNRKEVRMQDPSRQKIEALTSGIEHLKALLQAPPLQTIHSEGTWDLEEGPQIPWC